MVVAADVSDRAEMRQALDLARQRFGRIDGVIHAAGVAGGGLVQLKTREMAERILASKVDGTLILAELMQKDRPDFLMLCSSVNAICGNVGAVDYTAGNAFLDAFANSRASEDGCAVVSVNWDTWQQVGMAVNTEVPSDMRAAWLENLQAGIKPGEGVWAFQQLLGAGLSQVAVVTRDLRLNLERLLEPKIAGANALAPPVATGAPRHARPSVQDAYVEPATDVQRKIVEIWKELLGIEDIGIDDNFFALGGHSLLATGVLARIRTSFDVNLSLRTLFDSPSVRKLADQVDIVLWATSGASGLPMESAEREEIEL
jgi:NAD(P)-dependent dehydrogenase (short-subunit alcohol dehydrogenase family)